MAFAHNAHEIGVRYENHKCGMSISLQSRPYERTMYTCKCGYSYVSYKGLKRHGMANEFCFNCRFCLKLFTSYDR